MTDDAAILELIIRVPGLRADDIAALFGMPTNLVVDVVGKLIDEGELEYSEE